MIDVFWLPGSGFSTGPDGISSAFGAALDDRFRFVSLRYPAEFGVRMSYTGSVMAGRQMLVNAIRETENRAVVGGYSQGAAAAGSLAAAIGRGEYPDLGVEACALIADPGRPPGSGCPGLPTASGYGISGPVPVDRIVPTYWAAAEGDPITALPAGNPLRFVADLTEWMSLASPGDAHRWGVDLVDRAVRGRWQRWWSLENVRSWGGAVAYARGYLPRPVGDGRHTDSYITEGLAVGLARAINEAVRE